MGLFDDVKEIGKVLFQQFGLLFWSFICTNVYDDPVNLRVGFYYVWNFISNVMYCSTWETETMSSTDSHISDY